MILVDFQVLSQYWPGRKQQQILVDGPNLHDIQDGYAYLRNTGPSAKRSVIICARWYKLCTYKSVCQEVRNYTCSMV
jgi:hypothetical protein